MRLRTVQNFTWDENEDHDHMFRELNTSDVHNLAESRTEVGTRWKMFTLLFFRSFFCNIQEFSKKIMIEITNVIIFLLRVCSEKPCQLYFRFSFLYFVFHQVFTDDLDFCVPCAKDRKTHSLPLIPGWLWEIAWGQESRREENVARIGKRNEILDHGRKTEAILWRNSRTGQFSLPKKLGCFEFDVKKLHRFFKAQVSRMWFMLHNVGKICPVKFQGDWEKSPDLKHGQALKNSSARGAISDTVRKRLNVLGSSFDPR